MKAGRHLIGCVGFMLAAAAVAAGPQSDSAATGSTPAARDAGASMPSRDAGKKGGPQSPAREGVAADFKDGRQNCNELQDDKARQACEARAAATAESPRGREGANPTGKSQPPRGVGETAQ